MFDRRLIARMRPHRMAAIVLGTTAFIAPLGPPAGAAPVTCAIPQPCAMYTNTVGSAIAAVTAGKSGKNAAVMGTDASTNGGTNDGVFGIVGNGGWGVEGQSGAGSSGGGVAGEAVTAIGVYGLSVNGPGVRAQSSRGAGLYATSGSGTAITASSSLGNGVVSTISSTSGKHAALMGTDASTNGGTNDGVFGIVGNGGWGVEGQSGNGASGGGVAGTATTGTGVYGYSTDATGIEAQSAYGTALYALSALGTGINASSATGTAINASSVSGNGIVAGTSSTNGKHAALMGTDTSTNGGTNDGVFGIVGNGGWGVEGQSGDGSAGGGVVGTATTATGVAGSSYSGYGIVGQSTTGYGVLGESNTTDGVHGYSESGSGVVGVSENLFDQGYGVLGLGSDFGVAGESGLDPIVGIDELSGNYVFRVDNAGDIYYSGILQNSAVARPGMVTTGYTTRSTAPNVENVGTGNLAAGKASIRFDSAFQAAIDPHAKYQVFLTPDGDTKGLFVSAKAPTGFTVREAQGGRDSVSFDYRIVAPALGHSKERMQLVAGTGLGPSHLKMPKTKYFLPKIVRMRFPLPKR